MVAPLLSSVTVPPAEPPKIEMFVGSQTVFAVPAALVQLGELRSHVPEPPSTTLLFWLAGSPPSQNKSAPRAGPANALATAADNTVIRFRVLTVSMR